MSIVSGDRRSTSVVVVAVVAVVFAAVVVVVLFVLKVAGRRVAVKKPPPSPSSPHTLWTEAGVKRVIIVAVHSIVRRRTIHYQTYRDGVEIMC